MEMLKLSTVVLVVFFIKHSFMLGSKVTQDKIEISWYNDSYYGNPKMKMFNYGGSGDVKAVNASFNLKKDLPDVIMIHVQVYKLSSNEYRTFPLNVTTEICPVLAKDTPEMKKLREHSNMTGCPMKKGFYYMSNMILEQHKAPPYIPSGSYMAEATTSINKNINLLTTRSYAKVE